jgi:hypothetical protein
MNNCGKNLKLKKENGLLTFLEQTKDGKFAPIEIGAATISRIDIETEEAFSELEQCCFIYR